MANTILAAFIYAQTLTPNPMAEALTIKSINPKLTLQECAEIVDAAHFAGREMGIDPHLLYGIFTVESTFNKRAVNKTTGAAGLGQVWAKWHGDRIEKTKAKYRMEANLHSAMFNALLSAGILKEYTSRFGFEKGLAVYSGGASQYREKVLKAKSRFAHTKTPPPKPPIIKASIKWVQEVPAAMQRVSQDKATPVEYVQDVAKLPRIQRYRNNDYQ